MHRWLEASRVVCQHRSFLHLELQPSSFSHYTPHTKDALAPSFLYNLKHKRGSSDAAVLNNFNYCLIASGSSIVLLMLSFLHQLHNFHLLCRPLIVC